MSTRVTDSYESTDAMPATCAEGLRNTLLAMADTKLLLGYHYGEWTFGPPELEAAVAACSLCQAELGHVRLLHGILKKHYGDDPDALVDDRPATAFANVAFLDHPISDWAGLIAANYVVDLAVTRLLHSMRGSAFTPLRMSLEKMLDEERYHIHHGQGWFRTIAGRSDECRLAVERTVQQALTTVAVWFGPADEERDCALVNAGIKSKVNSDVLRDLVNDITRTATPLGVRIGVEIPERIPEWNPATRRASVGGPDEDILYHLRGSKNAIFKLT